MTKSDTIADIMKLNPSVDAGFLAEFANNELLRYLQRLRSLADSQAPPRNLAQHENRLGPAAKSFAHSR